jgi:hypothetical protein
LFVTSNRRISGKNEVRWKCSCILCVWDNSYLLLSSVCLRTVHKFLCTTIINEDTKSCSDTHIFDRIYTSSQTVVASVKELYTSCAGKLHSLQ